MNRCACRGVIAGTFEETLDCPLPFRPVPGGRWAHLVSVPQRLWVPPPRDDGDTAEPDIGPSYEWYRERQLEEAGL